MGSTYIPDTYQVREKVGANMKPTDLREKEIKYQAAMSRHEHESKKVASLNLTRSPENEYNRELRCFVPRSRLIGADGIVRAMRTTNEEPLKRPKDSTYMKMTKAFTDLRQMGVNAKWNIMVPESDTFVGYWCSLPEFVGPRVTHWRAADVTNSSISTGLQWAKDWEPVQDAIHFECINGAEKFLIDSLKKQDIHAEIRADYEHHVNVEVIFRGDGGACKAMWTWIDYSMSANPIEAPPIGSRVDDPTPYLKMFYS